MTSRWMSLVNVANVPIGYPDRAQRDARLLVYTSAPLTHDVELTGHPLIALHLRCSAPDAALFVYLEDVLPDGEVYYVTEGLFRAVHRRIDPGPRPYELPVPHHTFRRGDAQPLARGEVAEVTFDLLPVSYLFRRGHAIRIAIAGADADNFAPVLPAPPEIEVLRSPAYPSHVALPIADR
jgi:putative CocE/NonD family hydrolase